MSAGTARVGKPERRDWRWLGSRWVIVPGTMALVTFAWLAYVAGHAHGLIEGQVVDAAGAPVAGATVQLFERGFVTHQERARATTDAQGRFRFTDNRSHSIQLEAATPQLGRSERRIVRLWFAAQDVRLERPLGFPAPSQSRSP
jgi:hypothetical protein